LWYVLHNMLIVLAVRADDPAFRVRSILRRDLLVNDLCEIGTALVLAISIATAGWPVLIPALPVVIALQRSFRHAQLVSTARLDAKTGLLNAATWHAEATVQLARAQRAGTPVAVAMADIDHFKAVNDTYGHLAGDAVLAAVATGFRGQLRQGDLLGRFGGEEFAVFLPGADIKEAYQVVDRLRRDLASQLIPAADGADPLRVTVSIGMAAAADPAGRDLTDLLAAADNALYTAKATGRNIVRVSLSLISSLTILP
jgi:diguanylate cyclase (GGDEF)-like protein